MRQLHGRHVVPPSGMMSEKRNLEWNAWTPKKSEIRDEKLYMILKYV